MGQPPMNAQELIDTAKALVAGDKGLLAMDESNPTCNKRFARLGIPQTEEARRAYRELIVTTPVSVSASAARSSTTRRSASRRKMALPLSKSSPMRESFPASKWTPGPRTWPVIPERKSPKVWTDCATAWRNTPKWAPVLPSGAR